MSEKSTLVDPFDRVINYVRLSVTDRCNLRCTYCMSEKMEFLPRQKLLTLEEIRDIGEAFISLGVNRIRLTGGEPLVRRGLVSLVDSLASHKSLGELTMTTNGMLLETHASDLKTAGLKRLNISVDSLDPKKFNQLTRFGDIDQWYRGVYAAKKVGFSKIKLNVVVLKGFNESEISDVAKSLNLSSQEVQTRIDELHEHNPMLGHRGCRLGISFPEIYEMQCKAIFEALIECKNNKVKPIMPCLLYTSDAADE